jgi:hypothetical protein
MVELSEINKWPQEIKIISELNHEQIIFFAWLCSMRVLPFLGLGGSFSFWKKNKVNWYLYGILSIFDIAANYDDNTAYVAIDAAIAAIDVTITARDARYAAIAARDVARAAKAAIDAARAARAASDTTLTVRYATIAARAARDATIDAIYATRAARDNSQENIILDDIIFKDILYIKNGTFYKFNNDISLYGNTWNNFQTALNDVGCGYWGRKYKNIFQNRFIVDEKVLKMRLSVPQEIKDQGAKAVADYLELMESEGIKKLNEARIIILGEKGAGKTCLARRLINPEAPMAELKESTEGVNNTIWKIKSKDAALIVNAHIWDFAGHAITHAAHRCFLSERCLYILVYDGRTERRNQIEYWLDHVRNYGGNAPVLILINIFDNHIPDIPKNTLRQKYPFIHDFIYLSIKEDKDALKKFRMETSKLILNNLILNSQNMPLSYYKVKDTLRELFDKKIEYIPKEQFYKKASENNVTNKEKQDILLEHLHWLGICLWYKDIKEFGGLVLNPDWITNGIYKVINWAHEKSKSTISLDDFEIIFKDEEKRYPKDKFKFILELMRKYELAYSKGGENISIPHILREDQPDKLPDFPIQESLMLNYEFTQPLPPNTVCRLIVRRHEEIQSDTDVWRYGVVLKYKKDTIALVYEDDRSIVIMVKGNDKSEYISKLRQTMDEIFKSYKSEKPELRYRLIVNEPIENDSFKSSENKQVLVSSEDIISHIVNGKHSYYYSRANLEIPLNKTINIYKIDIHNNTIENLSVRDQAIIKKTFNFNYCNFRLQSNINSLIRTLDSKKDSDIIEELQGIISDLKKTESLKSKAEVKKSGLLNKLGKFIEDLGDEKSRIHKVINGIKNGAWFLQGIVRIYNHITQWLG